MFLQMEYLALAGVISALIAYLISQRQPKSFPKGPWGFPIVGHLPLLGPQPHKKLAEWKKSYGPIIGIKFGSFRCIVINDYKLIKEALSQNVFSGRPKMPYIVDRCFGKPEGIVSTDGQTWYEQRRFAIRHLKDFGFGTKSMESIVQDEIQELVESLKSKLGQSISTGNQFNVAVVNALWTIVAGERFEQNDPELHKIIKLLTMNFDEINPFSLLSNLVPWLAKYGPNWLTGYQDLLAPMLPTAEFIQRYIDQHFRAQREGGPPRDFIDAYIDEMRSTVDPYSSFHIDKKLSILMTVTDLFLAGAETASTTLSWIFLYMAKFPEVQQKLSDEIATMVGKYRLPTLDDRKLMPYAEAVIHEVLRCSTLLPLGIWRSTIDDTQFQGYDIPKDTMVIVNLFEAHNNQDFWGDPAEFRPERFLSADGAEFRRQEALLAFGTGKRACLGENLARDELFLFTTSLFQVFKICVDPSNPNPTLEPSMGAVLMPQKHHLVLELREGD